MLKITQDIILSGIRWLLSDYKIQIKFQMSDNEVNEMFAYLTKDNEIPAEKLKQIFCSIYKQSKPLSTLSSVITKSEFEAAFVKATQSERIEQQLLYLFYHLDRQKKGYLIPEDIMMMFQVIGRKITLNQIQNSFKYAKVYKNKMSFEDFKEYFHNF